METLQTKPCAATVTHQLRRRIDKNKGHKDSRFIMSCKRVRKVRKLSWTDRKEKEAIQLLG